jgi:hypothetical protein
VDAMPARGVPAVVLLGRPRAIQRAPESSAECVRLSRSSPRGGTSQARSASHRLPPYQRTLGKSRNKPEQLRPNDPRTGRCGSSRAEG